MGTSKSYSPPTGYLWRAAKTSVTGIVRNNGSSSSIGKAVSNFTKAVNGNGNGYSGRRAIISSSGAKAAGFILGVQATGLNSALANIGLENLVGKSFEETIVGLVEYFSSEAKLLDENVSKDSMSELMFEKFNNDSELEEQFKSTNIEGFITDYIVKCIQKDFLSNFAEKILSQNKNIKETISMQEKIKEFIDVTIKANYSHKDLRTIKWDSAEGKKIISDMHKDTVDIFLIWGEEND